MSLGCSLIPRGSAMHCSAAQPIKVSDGVRAYAAPQYGTREFSLRIFDLAEHAYVEQPVRIRLLILF